ncbi:Dynein heavy chain 12, axonemal [Tetrabaena socialis]|uniref:Dynein heavy chain 12, axonemal n=1 Tax=Tetrabaena socialis TaxID=47790 RepID=A0A2J8AGV7_9CHLO|nr:Dynein heavy chain 12, axonemal [Tetrabaena socialis]|eukprot:PNH11753.1 Dynein heavy chain 12, axonemal [Tetrabaena socialis]
MGSSPPEAGQPPQQQGAGPPGHPAEPAEAGPECKRRRRGPQHGEDTVAAATTAAAAPAAAAITAAAVPCGNDLDAAQPGWWLPQPHATLSPTESQDRPAAPLASCLSCALCHDLLREAITAPECSHTAVKLELRQAVGFQLLCDCYDCIDTRVEIGGNHNVCPVPGCGTVLGPNPFDHHRLLYDGLLDALVRKLYDCPLYRTSVRAGVLSTTGQSTNFVLHLGLRIAEDRDSDFWVMQGVAALCALDD